MYYYNSTYYIFNKNTNKTSYYIVITILLFILNQLISINLYPQSSTVTFNYTGSIQSWTVPQCVYTINVNAKGAKGGGYYGGLGANVTGNINVTPGQVLQIYVGGTGSCPGTGYNGGGNGASANTSSNAGCGGGGATDIRVSPYGLANRLIVAAGGGGMGGGDTDATGGVGGCASGGTGSSPFGVGGGGGSQSSGGSAGPPWISSGNWGQAGSLGDGGNSGSDPCYNRGPGGGGGGGYYGGGGGGSDCYSSMPLGGGGGGGGSSLTPAGGSCSQGNNSGNGSLTITYSPSAVAGTVSAPNTNICEGQSINLSVTGSVGNIQWQISTNAGASWSNISGSTGTSLNSGQLFNNTCYRVSADCGGTTVYSNTICINVNPIPIATATPTTQTFCTGGTTSIALSSSIGGTTFSWSAVQSGVTGASNSNGNSINQTLSTTSSSQGTTTYTITPTSGGCTGTPITVNITVNPNPTLSLTATPATLCYGDSTVLNASGASTYIWSNSLGNGSSHVVTPLLSTTYTVTGTNSYNCTSTSSINITVNPNPIINITPNSPSICEGASIDLTTSGATTYIWSNSLTNSTINVNPIITTTYTVTGTNSFTCTASEDIIVTVNPNPILNITPTSPAICIGNSINISASGGLTYLWNNASTSQVINVNPTITTTYSVTITDINNCTASDNVILTVNSFPPADAGPDEDICEGSSVQLNASGGTTYAWSPSNGLSNSSINNPIANPITTTTYIVTVTDASGCSGTDDIVINVLPNPAILITPTTASICLGDSINITASGASSYIWYPSNNLSNTNTASTVASPSSTTLYTVAGTNQYGCTNSSNITITVEPLPTITITPSYAGICSGSSINISAQGASTYTWSPSTGLSSTSGANIIASPIISTTYSVIGSTLGGCTAETSYSVNVLPSPTVNFSSNLIEGCAPLTVNFNDLSYDNIQSWLWDFNDISSGNSNSSNAQNPSHTFNSPGTYDINLSVTNSNGCIQSQTIQGMINVYPNPIASFVMSPSIGDMNQPTISFLDQSTNATFWSWNFGESSSGINNFSNLPSPSHTYLNPGTYSVWLYVESAIGCSDSVSNNITIQESYTFWAPSAFSPNDDGINDFFIPKGTGIDPNNFKMYIYDRWGKEIFFTESFNNPWDGKTYNNNTTVAQGVYTWIVFTKDRTGMDRKYVGRVILLP